MIIASSCLFQLSLHKHTIVEAAEIQDDNTIVEPRVFAEDGVEYDGYFFSQVEDRIVKIPLNKEKNAANAQFVMKNPYYSQFILRDGNLYINLADYMYHGGLFRLTSALDKPELIIKIKRDAGNLDFVDSWGDPEELKFLFFSDYDDGYLWGEIYCFFPQENVVKKMVDISGCYPFFNICDIVYNTNAVTTDDSIIVTHRQGRGFDPIVRIDKITVDLATKSIVTSTLLDSKRTPKAYRAFISHDETKLYLFGKCFWVYDFEEDTIRQVLDFTKILPSWPNDDRPYGDVEAYFNDSPDHSVFLTRNDGNVREFCLSDDTKMILIDVELETFTVGNDHFEKFKEIWPDFDVD
jgi:hypothetical protein